MYLWSAAKHDGGHASFIYRMKLSEMHASGWYNGVVGEKTDVPNNNEVSMKTYYKGLSAGPTIYNSPASAGNNTDWQYDKKSC